MHYEVQMHADGYQKTVNYVVFLQEKSCEIYSYELFFKMRHSLTKQKLSSAFLEINL